MSLVLAATRAGIFDRAMDILEDTTDATNQIAIGIAQIRSYRLWRSRGRRQ